MTSLVDAQDEIKRLQGLVDLLEVEASTDALTGLLNRRGGDRVLDQKERRARHDGTQLSAILIDLDHFKLVNDEHGHAMGDSVLRLVAGVVNQHLRSTDEAIRWGGEEMFVITENDLEGARALAERLRRSIPLGVLVDGKGVTASFGVAEWEPVGNTAAMFRRADTALYRAKDAGRDRVETEES